MIDKYRAEPPEGLVDEITFEYDYEIYYKDSEFTGWDYYDQHYNIDEALDRVEKLFQCEDTKAVVLVKNNAIAIDKDGKPYYWEVK